MRLCCAFRVTKKFLKIKLSADRGRAPARDFTSTFSSFSFGPHNHPSREVGFSRKSREAPQGPGSPRGAGTQPGGPGLPCPLLSVRAFLFLTGCFWDKGHLYRANQSAPAPGFRCLNWLDAQGGPGSALQAGECPRRAAGGWRPRYRPRPGPGPRRLLSPPRRPQPQLLPEPRPGSARALVLHQRRGRRAGEADLRGPAVPRDHLPSLPNLNRNRGGV